MQLQHMLSSIINNAHEKLAAQKQAEEMSKMTNEKPGIVKQLKDKKKEEKVNEGSEKTAAYVEKVASALEYIVDNFDDLLPKGPLARAFDKVANLPGEGAGSLEVSKSGKPHADYAKKDKMAVTEDPATPKTEKGPQGKTPDTLEKKPGGGLLKTELYVNKPSGTSKEAALAAVLSKLAGEDVLKAKVKSGGTESTKMKTYTANEGAGTPPGHDQSGYGNENEHHIMSNQGAIDMTKREAKREYINREVGRAFEEPKANSDTTLDRAWTRGKDTAKLAELKLAEAVEQGCVCNGQGSCDYCKAKSAVMKKLAFFRKLADDASAAAGPPIPGQGGPPVPGDPAAGGMPPGAGAGPVPPGCTCGGQGICKMCQLMMILAKAKGGAQQQGSGPGADPTAPPGAGGGMPGDQPMAQ